MIKKNKKRYKYIAIPLVILLVALVSTYFYYNSVVSRPFVLKSEKVMVEVKEKDTLYSVLKNLNDKNYLKSEVFLKAFLKLNKINSEIKPGIYSINNIMGFKEFVDNINKGDMAFQLIKTTIPEGFDINGISDLLDKNEIVSKVDFLKAVNEYQLPEYVKENKEKRYSLEGYLFPNTYMFKKNSTGKEVLDSMVKQFEKTIAEIKKETGINISNNDLEKQIIIASMIEKEARIDSERDTIASVINNRIKLGMKLQIDATILYAIGYHKDVVTIKDTQLKSPFNTYNVSGLPIGPICSPGKNSIVGALKPKATNYIYYVYKNNAKHFFTNSYNEFLKEKKKYGY